MCTFGLVGCAALSGPPRTAGAPAPVVHEMATVAGSLSGGEAVTITGENLAAVSRVTFGGRAATGITEVSNETVIVTVPHSIDYSAGTVEVEVFATADFDRVASTRPLAYDYQTLTAVDRQLEYAFDHWRDYNTAQYGDFNALGGDCMNFVSQTLVARGWTQTAEWFNDRGIDWASPFIYVPAFDEWMTAHPEYGAVKLGMKDIDKLKVGDVVMLDWERNGFFNHAQIVSGVEHVDGETEVYMVGHNLDSIYRDLGATVAAESPDAIAWFWSLPAG